jgi:hypothetical protein
MQIHRENLPRTPQLIRRRDQDGEPVREIVRSYNVAHSTISRLTAVTR